MKKTTRFLSLLLAMTVVFASVNMTSFAEEYEEPSQEEVTSEDVTETDEDYSENDDQSEGSTFRDEALSDDEPDQSQVDETEMLEEDSEDPALLNDSADESEIITEIKTPDTITTHYKLALDSLKEKFPGYLEAYTDKNSEVILSVCRWTPVDDYDKSLGTYTFSPSLDTEYQLAENVEVPVLTVCVEDESDGPTGFIESGYEEEVPLVQSAAGNGIGSFNAAPTDSKYNGYEANLLPEVRAQDNEGSSWAFAALGAVEADLIKSGKASASTVDASELHLAYFTSHNYTDPKNCRPNDSVSYSGSNYLDNGGDDHMAVMALMNGIGPVEEKYAPYSKGSNYNLDESYALNKNFARVDNVYDINISDRSLIKKAILQHGAVTANINSTTGYYSAVYNSYYGTTNTRNHELLLVGWDDTFSAENFGGDEKPAGDGAWLARNSWGLDDYGKNGYFWISYEDASLTGGGSVRAYSVDTRLYDNVYSYAAGENISAITGDSNTVTFSVDYRVKAGETVKAVAVQTLNANATIKVTVTGAGQTATGSVSNETAGTYTVPLSTALETTADTDVTVTVKITAASNDRAKIVIESFADQGEDPAIGTQRTVNIGGISHIVTLDKGFKTGSVLNKKGDPVIRLYTNSTGTTPPGPAGKLELTNSPIFDHAGAEIQLVLSSDSVVTDPSLLTWSSIDENKAVVSATGLVTVGRKKGKTVVKGEYSDGENTYEVSIDVTVKGYSITYNLGLNEVCRKKYSEYYPGDPANCKLPVAADMSKDGYELRGWEDDGGNIVTADTLRNSTGNITISPIWTIYSITVRYYKPKEDASGYTSTKKYIYSFMINKAPYTIPAPEDIEDGPLSYVESGKKFTYWSLDPEGEQPITAIGQDYFKAKQNEYTGTYSITKDIAIYPQFDKPIPTPTPTPTPTPKPKPKQKQKSEPAWEPEPSSEEEDDPPAVVPTPVAASQTVITARTTTNVRLRQGAGTNYKTLVVVKYDSPIQITGPIVNGWYPCKYGIYEGYMSARYLLPESKDISKSGQEYHVVTKGDSLYNIARRNKTTVEAIISKNKSSYPKIRPNYIMVGWILKL